MTPAYTRLPAEHEARKKRHADTLKEIEQMQQDGIKKRRTKMKKFHYRLMCAGIKNVVVLFGKPYPLPTPWHAPYYSDERYVVANDEEIARAEIREKLRRKWTGFVITREADIE